MFAVIDALFGGAGKFHTRIEGRDFSPTEQRIIARLVGHHRRVQKAWHGIYPLELDYQRSGDAAAVRQHRHAQRDRGRYLVHAGDRRHRRHHPLLHPYSTLEPIRDVLYSTMQGDSSEPDRRWVNLLKNQIQAAEVELVAELAHAAATVEQLLAFKPGDFPSSST